MVVLSGHGTFFRDFLTRRCLHDTARSAVSLGGLVLQYPQTWQIWRHGDARVSDALKSPVERDVQDCSRFEQGAEFEG